MPPSGIFPIRNLGPCKSTIIARSRSHSSETLRRSAIAWAWVVGSPWEQLILATSTPAKTIARITEFLVEAGPIVETIFVLRN
jgi:hypothetical protein